MIKNGTRLQSQVCDTQVIVVRASDTLDGLRAGGAPMVPVGDPIDASLSLNEAFSAGTLMGIKTVLNELIAYLQMSRLPADALDPRSRLIMVYAMCGFANFGSVGIMIGGLAAMAPERRSDVISLGMKSIVSGTLSTLLMGAIVGILN